MVRELLSAVAWLNNYVREKRLNEGTFAERRLSEQDGTNDDIVCQFNGYLLYFVNIYSDRIRYTG